MTLKSQIYAATSVKISFSFLVPEPLPSQNPLQGVLPYYISL